MYWDRDNLYEVIAVTVFINHVTRPISNDRMALVAERPVLHPTEGGRRGGRRESQERDHSMYRVSFITVLAHLSCPVEGLRVSALSRTNLWVQFDHQHYQDTIVILEEGNQPQPRCPQCDMFVTQKALDQAHPDTAMCWRGPRSKWWKLVAADTKEQIRKVFLAYGTLLKEVTSFKYLGPILSPPTMIGHPWRRINGRGEETGNEW